MNDRLTPEYRAYLESPQWKELRRKAIERYEGICAICLRYCSNPDVHHKHYRNFKNEDLEDLEVLCRECHDFRHAADKMLADLEFYLNRVKGYAIKVFGNYWHDFPGPAKVEETFRRWRLKNGETLSQPPFYYEEKS